MGTGHLRIQWSRLLRRVSQPRSSAAACSRRNRRRRTRRRSRTPRPRRSRAAVSTFSSRQRRRACVVNVVVNEGAKKLFEGSPSSYPHTITGFAPGTHTVTVDGWPTPPGGGGQKVFTLALTFGVEREKSASTISGFTPVISDTSLGSATVDFGRKFTSSEPGVLHGHLRRPPDDLIDCARARTARSLLHPAERAPGDRRSRRTPTRPAPTSRPATLCTTPDQTAANARWESGHGVLVYGASHPVNSTDFESWDLTGLTATITGVPA